MIQRARLVCSRDFHQEKVSGDAINTMLEDAAQGDNGNNGDRATSIGIE